MIPAWSNLGKESRWRELTTIIALGCHLLDFPLQRSQRTYSGTTRVEIRPITEARIGIGVESELCLLDLGDRWRIGYWNGEGWYDREGMVKMALENGGADAEIVLRSIELSRSVFVANSYADDFRADFEAAERIICEHLAGEKSAKG